MTSFKSAVSEFYGGYFVFGGRSDRSQYWWVALYILCVEAVLWLLTCMCHDGSFFYYVWKVVAWLFGVVNFLPGLALSVRRLHDTGRGGGWIFINFVPLIGEIWYLILMLLPGEGPNRFGNPVDD